MRDVMDGLEDAASYLNYQSNPDVVEILSIEPPDRHFTSCEANVITMSALSTNEQSSNIVEYLIQREQKISA